MLIDTHIHTKRCHHAEGDLEDYIIEAIKKGIKIIGIFPNMHHLILI